MSKNSKKRRNRAAVPTALPESARCLSRRRYVTAALIACAVLAGSFAATRYEPVRRAVGMRPLVVTSAQGGTQLPLSKEYVYAGGRLVATEDPPPASTPTPTQGGPSPTALVATGYFPSANSASVKLVWAAPSSGSPTSYVVERASSRN
jgi:hypothetical protein